MEMYQYTFDIKGVLYHVYAPSKVEALAAYLEENGITELPTGCTITRYNF